jgi:hypothetical protein
MTNQRFTTRAMFYDNHAARRRQLSSGPLGRKNMKTSIVVIAVYFVLNSHQCFGQNIDFFPLQKGNTYTYKYSQITIPGNGGNLSGDGDFTLTILDSTVNGDTVKWKINSDYYINRFENGRGSYIDSGSYSSQISQVTNVSGSTIILGYIKPLNYSFLVNSFYRFYPFDSALTTINYDGPNIFASGYIQITKSIGLTKYYRKDQIGFPGYSEEQITLTNYHLTSVDRNERTNTNVLNKVIL